MATFLTTFWLILVTEIADKSRIAGLVLMATFRAPYQIFFGMTLGYAVLEGVAVMVSRFFPMFIPILWVQFGVALLFIGVGLATWFTGEEAEDHARKWLSKIKHWGAFLVSFVAISLSEIGDRTQVAASALSAKTGQPGLVYLGAMGALTLLNLVTVWIGDRLGKLFPQKTVRRFAALLFILVGFAMAGDLLWTWVMDRTG